jgi:hypothetical protein
MNFDEGKDKTWNPDIAPDCSNCGEIEAKWKHWLEDPIDKNSYHYTCKNGESE